MNKTKPSVNENVYISLIIVTSLAAAFAAYLPFQISDKYVSLSLPVITIILSMTATFVITKQWREQVKDAQIQEMKREHEDRLRMMEREHDISNLEKTIREGTLTLIKNALDYFKLENIKNEIGDSAAIENLQLDKYGQIIELLAEFSLILPDVTESQKIVQEELYHQINIYKIDEKPFSKFLERIMAKYLITVSKKIQEKVNEESLGLMKTCHQCGRRVLLKANICKYCRYEFRSLPGNPVNNNMALDQVGMGKKLYDNQNYQDAVRSFTRAVELKPDFAIAYYNRAICHYKMGKGGAAKKDLQKAASLGHERARQLLKRQAERRRTNQP